MTDWKINEVLLAIVIPYYRIEFFDHTLRSLASQSDTRFRVYVGNNVCPDDPSLLLDNYKDQLDIVYTEFDTHIDGKYLAQQFNRCVNLAENEPWVMVLGDDDVLAENCIASFYEHLDAVDNSDVNIVRFATQFIDGEGKRSPKIYTHPVLEKSTHFLMRRLNLDTHSSLSEYIFKRDKLLEAGFRDVPLAWWSDVLAVLEVSDFDNVYSINDAIVYFRMCDKNFSGMTSNSYLKSRATLSIFHYLLTDQRSHFSTEDQKQLLTYLENAFLEDKLYFRFWIPLVSLYISRREFGRCAKYFLKFVGAIFLRITGR